MSQLLHTKNMHIFVMVHLIYKEIDAHLKRTCEVFINHVSSQLVFPIKDFLSKVCGITSLCELRIGLCDVG